MGHFVIKAAKGKDLYMHWSTVVESPIFIGNRDEILKHLEEDEPGEGPSSPRARVLRADESGSSAMPYRDGWRFGGWEDDSFIVEQRGVLPRSKLPEFLTLLDRDSEDCYALLEPFEDD